MAEPEAKSFASVPQADGSVERWELTDQWRLVRTDPPMSNKSDTDHTHPTPGDTNFIGKIQVGGYDGLNDRVTIGTKRLTFKEGICIGVEDV